MIPKEQYLHVNISFIDLKNLLSPCNPFPTICKKPFKANFSYEALDLSLQLTSIEGALHNRCLTCCGHRLPSRTPDSLERSTRRLRLTSNGRDLTLIRKVARSFRRLLICVQVVSSCSRVLRPLERCSLVWGPAEIP